MNKPKKILHIVPDLGYGGVEKIILNCYGQLNYDNYFSDGKEKTSTLEDYHSHNTTRLDVEGMKELLLKLDYIKEELIIFDEERKLKEIAASK